MGKLVDRLMHNKKLGIFCMILIMSLVPILSVAVPTQSYRADSWVQGTDASGIYGSDGDKGEKFKSYDSGQSGTNIFSITSSAIVSMVESFAGTFLDGVYGILKMLNMTIGSITMGRLDGGGINLNGTRVALYTYELADGNLYGVASMAMYGMERQIIYLVMCCIILAKFVGALYIHNTSKVMASLKESINTCLISFVLLTFIPNIVDLFIYIRDVILYALSHSMSSLVGASTIDISEIFTSIAKDEGNLINYCLVGVSYYLVFYYAISYTSVALSMAIHVIAFPFACITMLFDRQILKNWFITLFGYLLVPIMDFALLMIPGMFMMMDNSFAVAVIQLIVCCSILQGRKAFERAIGINSVQGELAGMAAMIGFGKLAGSLIGAGAGAVATAAAGKDAAAQSNSMADMYQEMADATNGSNTDSLKSRSAAGGTFGPDSNFDKNYESGLNVDGNGIPDGSGISDEIIKGKYDQKDGNDALNNKNAQSAMGNGMQNAGMKEQNRPLSGLDTQSNKADAMDTENGSSIPTDNAIPFPDNTNENFATDDVDSLDDASDSMPDSTMDRYNPMYDNMSGVTSDNLDENMDNTDGMNDMPASNNAGFNGMADGIDTTSQRSPEQQEADRTRRSILEKYATADNVDNPMFRNISPARKAELYRERAKQQQADARKQVASQLGFGMLGGALGFGAGLFYGPGVAAMTTSMGIDAGRRLGAFATRTKPHYVTAGSTFGGNAMQSGGASPNESSNDNGSRTNPSGGSGSAGRDDITPTGTFYAALPYADQTDAIKIPKKYDTFEDYQSDFMMYNAANIMNATRDTFGGDSVYNVDDVLKNTYSKYPDSYADFRNSAADQLQEQLQENMGRQSVSRGNAIYDKVCIHNLADEFSNRVLNPLDENNVQKDLQADHVLSRESLAARGYSFKI